MSFDLFAYRELKDVVPDCEDRYDMIERNLVQPKERGRYWEKRSPDFLNQMEGYLMELEDSLMDIRDFTYRNYEIKASRILLLFYTRFLEIPLLSRMDAVLAGCAVDDYETLSRTGSGRGRTADIFTNSSWRCMRREISMCCTAVFWSLSGCVRFHRYGMRSVCCVMRMSIRCCI